MAHQEKYIENLFAEKFEDFTVKPSTKIWQNINRRVRLQEFLKFNITKFNIFYLAAIIGITSLLFLQPGQLPPAKTTDNPLITQKVEAKKSLITPEKEPETITKNIVKEKKATLIATPKKAKRKLGIKLNTKNSLTKSTEKFIPTVEAKNSFSKKEQLLVKATASTTEGCANLKVDFKNISDNAETYLWNFGDENTSEQENPTHTYTVAGTYNVTLTVENQTERFTKQIAEIKVHETPKAKISIQANEFEKNEHIKFTNTSLNTENYLWDFGDGNKSVLSTPIHSYRKAGNYTVKLKTWTQHNCYDSTTISSIIIEPPKYHIVFPNAFMANTVGPIDEYVSNPKTNNNQLFIPLTTGVVSYELSIFNRAGQRLFLSNESNRGWNGYYKEKLMPEGVYVWHVKGTFEDGKPFTQSGNITLFYKK